MTPEIRHWEKMRDNLVTAMAGLMAREPPMVMVVTEGEMDRELRFYSPEKVEFQERPPSPTMQRAQQTLAELNHRIEREWQAYLDREIGAAMTPMEADPDPAMVMTARYR